MGSDREVLERGGKVHGLTPAEASILARVALGATTRQAAEECGKSYHTAKVQLNDALRKLPEFQRRPGPISLARRQQLRDVLLQERLGGGSDG